VTTSILNFENLREHLPPEFAATLPDLPSLPRSEKPLSMQEFLERAQSLFTPEEAEELARRVEEGRAEAHD
jgi:hypothetical protein